MYESNNKNNNLTDQALDAVLVRAGEMFARGACLFEAGIKDTAEFGKVSSLCDVFKNSVLAVCRDEKIALDEKALQDNIRYSNHGPLFGGITTGGFERARFKRSAYDRDYALIFRAAMGPEVRSQMIAPLRASLVVQTAPVVKARALAAA